MDFLQWLNTNSGMGLSILVLVIHVLFLFYLALFVFNNTPDDRDLKKIIKFLSAGFLLEGVGIFLPLAISIITRDSDFSLLWMILQLFSWVIIICMLFTAYVIIRTVLSLVIRE